MSTKLVKKLTSKSILGNVASLCREHVEEGDSIDAYTVIGLINGYRKVSSQYGDSIGFKGTFEAINHISGEVIKGTELFAPSVAEPEFAIGVDEHGTIEVAYKVSIVRGENDDTGAIKYEYVFSNLGESTHNSALDDLRSLVPELAAPEGAKKKKIAAPKKAAKKVPAKKKPGRKAKAK